MPVPSSAGILTWERLGNHRKLPGPAFGTRKVADFSLGVNWRFARTRATQCRDDLRPHSDLVLVLTYSSTNRRAKRSNESVYFRCELFEFTLLRRDFQSRARALLCPNSMLAKWNSPSKAQTMPTTLTLLIVRRHTFANKVQRTSISAYVSLFGANGTFTKSM